MKTALQTLFAMILLAMLAVTTWASLDRPVWQAGYLFAEPWFVATLLDAYCGFVTFYVWVAYRERSLLARGLWLFAILVLGNLAMATYVLLQLRTLRRGEPLEELLRRR